jgi:hypothetical protein
MAAFSLFVFASSASLSAKIHNHHAIFSFLKSHGMYAVSLFVQVRPHPGYTINITKKFQPCSNSFHRFRRIVSDRSDIQQYLPYIVPHNG